MRVTFLDRFLKHPPNPPAPQHDGLAQVRGYWEALRPAGGLPARTDIDPRGFGGTLDRIFLAERIGRGVAQIRIAGSTLCAFAETDLRGLPLGCLFAAETRAVIGESLEAVVNLPAICNVDLGSDRLGQGKAMARLILMPLAPENGSQQVIGAFGFTDPSPRTCKLQALGRSLERLATELPARADELEAPRPAPIRVAGHLKLVHSAG
jgi:hypothetical protein